MLGSISTIHNCWENQNISNNKPANISHCTYYSNPVPSLIEVDKYIPVSNYIGIIESILYRTSLESPCLDITQRRFQEPFWIPLSTTLGSCWKLSPAARHQGKTKIASNNGGASQKRKNDWGTGLVLKTYLGVFWGWLLVWHSLWRDWKGRWSPG